mgnify:CR=1 FL=1
MIKAVSVLERETVVRYKKLLMRNVFADIWTFYRDGFRNMTWGRTLWLFIVLKLIILFGILRIFFFRPVLSDMSEAEKSESVGRNLTNIVWRQH